MKLDKITFAHLIAYVCGRGANLDSTDVQMIDDIIDIDYVSCESVDKLLQLMNEGHRWIEAIKAYRTLTGAGLKESKEAIEKYWTAKTPPQSVNLESANLESANISGYNPYRNEATLGDILGNAIKHAPDED